MLVISADGTYVIEDDGTIHSLGSSDLTAGDDAAATALPGRGPGRRPPSGGPKPEQRGSSAQAE